MSSKQDLFREMDTHLQKDEQPSQYFNSISEEPIFAEYPFFMLNKMKRTKQSPRHHPEGNVWNHTMLVVDMAAGMKSKSENPTVFLWAALLHDIGKPDTTQNRKGKITSYNHDKLGAELARDFLAEFTLDSDFIESVASLVRWHMQLLFVVNDLRFAEVKAMKQQVNLNEVALLGLCDRLGRLGADRQREESNVHTFLQKCKAFVD
jgi:putative nucleotidyltransferase with HDIG domain